MSNHSIATYRDADYSNLLEIVRDFATLHHLGEIGKAYLGSCRAIVANKNRNTVVWIRKLGPEPNHLYQAVGSQLGCHWINVIFLEKVVWQYLSYRGSELLDQYEPKPELWGETELKLGNAKLLSEIWGVKCSRIACYLRPWRSPWIGKRAYWWRDRSRTGQFEQGYDFLRALTGISIS
jgi:hypothetical protein